MTVEWTLEELVRRAAQALAAASVHAPNARVTAVPDARLIRWYSTVGLVDRPTAMRGRTAVYGERHLLQLVAIKRRQAEGHTLAAIQAELAGATLATLRQAAGIVAAQSTSDASAPDTPVPVTSTSVASTSVASTSDVSAPEVVEHPVRFWASPPRLAPLVPAPVAATVPPAPQSTPSASERDADSVGVGHAIAVGQGAILVLPALTAMPTEADIAAIRAAAQAIHDVLVARGLAGLAHSPARSTP